jgi:peptidoglycan-N-acetylglucosamine deacetylase
MVIVTILFSLPLYTIKAEGEKEKDREIEVYLTFDDGPSYVTEYILNILREKNIKATFFIVGSQIKGREEILKHIYADGHTIGLHSYSHNYKKLYKSQNSFLEEMYKTSEEISKVLNIKSDIIRFPGGSKPHLNDIFLERLHENSYKVFDWNVTVSDGLDNNKSPNALFREATKVKSTLSRIIILLHCGGENINTCKALPKIIQYYDKEPYHFSRITQETKEYYFRYKK